jgi:transposase
VEANEERREEYLAKLSTLNLGSLVDIDESGIELTICKDRSWSLKGQPIKAKKSGKYYQRTNIIAGLVNNKSIAPMVFNGFYNTELFNSWVENFLIKGLNPGQVVVMDNASFHKSQRTKELIESIGCRILFLPPYSPDLNPIEKFWANMKRWIKNRISDFRELLDGIEQFFVLG